MTRVTQSQLDVFGYIVSKGLHEKGTAAIIGNFCQESGEDLDATMYRQHPDASGGVREDLKSGGLAEWLGDRKIAYISFSKSEEQRRGLAPGVLLNDRFTQCDFCLQELTSDRRYWDLYQQLTTDTGRSVATLTANFMEIYERPSSSLNAQGGRIDGLDNRINHANAVYERAQLIKNTGQAPTVPEPPLPPLPRPPMPTTPAGLPSVSASTAGRFAAVHAMLDELRVNYLAELKSIENEIAIIDTTIADFEKLSPVQAASPKLLTSKTIAAMPAVTTPQPRTNPMINWGTNLGGIGALFGAAFSIYSSIRSGQAPDSAQVGIIIMGLSSAFGLLKAKDSNVTGGTVSAATGMQTLRPVSVVDEQPSSMKK